MKILLALSRKQRAELEQRFQDIPPLTKDDDPLARLLVQTFEFDAAGVKEVVV